MFSIGFPDWKNIGWHVGKRLRDILNPPAKTGPSREERRAQRLRDRLKGFAYFDYFDELIDWSSGDIDPVQQANTPLLKRSASQVHDQRGPTTSVLLCHDYKGGYHDYESVRPPLLDEKLYSSNYLQYVDTFVYFSHKLVCVPPPTWTNTMHRNGVKVIGTFIVEPQTPHIEQMLDQVDGEYVVAKQLAAMADAFGFDGWLINVEGEFLSDVKNLVERLTGFIRSLKRSMATGGSIIWYDAITVDNGVDYQNGLTSKNVAFALAADAIFTNYKWTEAKLKETQSIAEKHGIRPSEIYFGVDVWAQNTNMPGPPRITFPPKGGGGTNTGLALSVLAEHGFSAAIFAPAWTHEHFSTLSNGEIPKAEVVEHAIWEGNNLQYELGCDCREGRPHHTLEYKSNPIVRFARESPAGSFFLLETNFERAFTQHSTSEDQGGYRFYSTLGSQGIMPHLLPVPVPAFKKLNDGPPVRILYGDLTDQPSQGLMVATKVIGSTGKLLTLQDQHRATPIKEFPRLCLFKVNMPADGSLEATVQFKQSRASRSMGSGFYVAYGSSSFGSIEYHYSKMAYGDHNDTQVANIEIRAARAGFCLLELGVYCEDYMGAMSPVTLCQIFNLSIKPKNPVQSSWTIGKIRIIERTEAPDVTTRITWNWTGPIASWPTELPWSKTTGPFSHFVISARGKQLGQAHCMEYLLKQGDLDGSTEEEIDVYGILFGGGKVSSLPFTFPSTAFGA